MAVQPTQVIDAAPATLGELPAYFARLSPEQLRSCWVACVLDCARVELPELGVKLLNDVLVSVRDHAASSERAGLDKIRRLAPAAQADAAAELVRAALDAAPEAAPEIALVDVLRHPRVIARFAEGCRRGRYPDLAFAIVMRERRGMRRRVAVARRAGPDGRAPADAASAG